MKYSIWFLVLFIRGINSFAQTDIQIGFGSVDVRYAKSSPPVIQPDAQAHIIAWKGERVHLQLLVYTKVSINNLRITAGVLSDRKGHSIPASAITTGFIRYVITDSLNKEGHGCGIPPASASDSILVADGIDPVQQKAVAAYNIQPVWVSIAVPKNTLAGEYSGLLYVHCDGSTRTLSYSIQVKPHTLPPPAQWSFHLDLWQNPYAVARIYGVKEWSKEHFDHLRPYMQWLAAAGQKTITVSMIHDPWRGQTYDIYKSMIRWIKKKDGTWRYDYSIFDQWVSFMQSLGINKLINCYTMVPWNNKFYYYDEALQRDTVLTAKTGTAEYEAHWRPMLTAFVQHLKQKDWYHKTAIAMDERPLEDMQKVIRLIRSVDKGLKISLAGSYHPELAGELYDYCIASAESFDSTVLRKRIDAGLLTTYYTYCWEGHPNTFTFSPPAEAAWLGWYAANKQFNGYLRWAYNCWPKNPLQDSRYSTWSAGDTYFVYPGGSSIRFERLIEGIQDYEKIRILKTRYQHQPQKLQLLLEVLKIFETAALQHQPAAMQLQKAKAVLNAY